MGLAAAEAQPSPPPITAPISGVVNHDTGSVKQGTAFFFPLLNSEADNVCRTPHLGRNCLTLEPFPQVLSVPKLRAVAADQQDRATGLHATLTPTNSLFEATGSPVNVGYARLQ